MTYECLLGKIPFRIYSELDLNRIVFNKIILGIRWNKVSIIYRYNRLSKRFHPPYNEKEARRTYVDQIDVTSPFYYQIPGPQAASLNHQGFQASPFLNKAFYFIILFCIVSSMLDGFEPILYQFTQHLINKLHCIVFDVLIFKDIVTRC